MGLTSFETTLAKTASTDLHKLVVEIRVSNMVKILVLNQPNGWLLSNEQVGKLETAIRAYVDRLNVK